MWSWDSLMADVENADARVKGLMNTLASEIRELHLAGATGVASRLADVIHPGLVAISDGLKAAGTVEGAVAPIVETLDPSLAPTVTLVEGVTGEATKVFYEFDPTATVVPTVPTVPTPGTPAVVEPPTINPTPVIIPPNPESLVEPTPAPLVEDEPVLRPGVLPPMINEPVPAKETD